MKPLNRIALQASLSLLLMLVASSRAESGVQDTVHNLSVSGPGEIKSDTEQQVCIFCHASHVPEGKTPLWNREMPPSAQYQVYKSATMRSRASQPDGASKLCLSCHDGTIALGKVLNRSQAIRMRGAGARGEIPKSRKSNLGTDLSGMHPISISYDDGVVKERNQDRGRVLGAESSLVNKAGVPKDLLDKAGRVQCTTCHDAHEDKFYVEGKVPRFWRRPSVSEVCEGCHSW